MSDGNYTPELGQALFGQPHKECEVPEIWHAALSFLRYEIERAYWNTHQEKAANPFDNSGGEFKTPEFHAVAYSWIDEDQPYNFKWRDIEISWYKYLGRGMSANKPLNPDLAAEMLSRCISSIRDWEKSHE